MLFVKLRVTRMFLLIFIQICFAYTLTPHFVVFSFIFYGCHILHASSELNEFFYLKEHACCFYFEKRYSEKVEYTSKRIPNIRQKKLIIAVASVCLVSYYLKIIVTVAKEQSIYHAHYRSTERDQLQRYIKKS